MLPWWATATRVSIGGVGLHGLLFCLWLAFFGRCFLLELPAKHNEPIMKAAFLLGLLAIWCGLVSLNGSSSFGDTVRSLKFFAHVLFVLALVFWVRQTGNLCLHMLILGFVFGISIHLIVMFLYPVVMAGTLRLYPQNLAGQVVAFGIHFSAWLFYRSDKPGVRLFALAAALLFCFAAAISSSRVAWFTGVMGLIAWVYVLIWAKPALLADRKRLNRLRWIVLPLLGMAFIALYKTPLFDAGLHWMGLLMKQKFALYIKYWDTGRLYEFVGTGEILLEHPFGVGYSGTYDAWKSTSLYSSGKVFAKGYFHSVFLHYALVGGLPGLLISIVLFFYLLNIMRTQLIFVMGRTGFIFFMLIALPCFVSANTETYLIVSMLLPKITAIIVGWAWSLRARQLVFAPVRGG